MNDSFTFNRGPLRGEVTVPGDKSISHRALIVGAALREPMRIENLNGGSDVAATVDALTALGARIEVQDTSALIHPNELHDASQTLNCRNSGSTARMVLGVCAGANLRATLDGDASLRRRPMEPIAAQLRAFGAQIQTDEGLLPMTIEGTPVIQTRNFILLSPSAQIKAALLFAGLFSRTAISIVNDAGSRDHTERLLQSLGAKIRYDGRNVDLQPSDLKAAPVTIPGDFSSAAFFIVGATIVAGSEITLRNVGMNPTRTGLLDALRAMGAAITVSNERRWNDEPVADITVVARRLSGASIGSNIAARAIDEIPVLAVAAACAQGITRIAGLRRLREKETDRLALIGRMLNAVGVDAEIGADDIQITGAGATASAPQAQIATDGDHRIAMAAAPLGAVWGPLTIDDAEAPAVSFPDFTRTWLTVQSR